MGRPHLIARIIVFSVNFTLWASGILLIVFGSIGVADPTATVKLLNMIDGISNVTDIMDVTKYVEGVAIFMIVLGCFLFLLGGNGCHGVLRKNRRSIMSYMGLLLCAVLVEIALIIYGSVYPGTTNDSVQHDLQKSIDNTFLNLTEEDRSPYFDDRSGKLIYSNNETAESWELLEFESSCCGATGKDSYSQFTIKLGPGGPQSAVPLSCCKLVKSGKLPTTKNDFVNYTTCTQLSGPEDGTYNTKACSKTVNDMIWQFNIIAIVLSSCLIAVELLGLIFSARLSKGDD